MSEYKNMASAGNADNAPGIPGPTMTPADNGVASGPAAAFKSCGGCGGRICDRFLLHAVDLYWHTRCLKCHCCQAPLGEIGSSCFTKGGMILCKKDYIRMFGSGGTCTSCGQCIPATELVMRVQQNVYHLKCFTCVTCHRQLHQGERFSIVNGNLLCEQDYPKVLRGHAQLPARSTHKVC